MARSRIFDQVYRAVQKARFCDDRGLSTHEGLACIEAMHEKRAQAITRRNFLLNTGAMTAAAALSTGLALHPITASAGFARRIAIIGGGLSGLVCADRLRIKGISATIYEANSRIGGRIHTTRAFPGQIAEMGGELIDNLHKTMLGYANEFKLLKEDLGKAPGDKHFYFGGQRYSEAEVVEEYRQLVPRLRTDLQLLSAAPTFFSHTTEDEALDQVSLAEYLATCGAGLPLIQGVLEQAYVAEYGLDTSQQSCLNMLLFLHADKAAKFREYGVFSDERYHLIGGNDAIPNAICSRLPGPVITGTELTRLSRNASGGYELYFRGFSTPELADAVVMTLPFSVLRRVTLDSSLGVSDDKLRAIQTLGYGANVKTMVGFSGRPWAEQGGNGLVYSDLPNLQTTWETNYANAGATAILTDYAGGSRGQALQNPRDGSVSGCNSCHNGPGGFYDIKDTVIQEQVDAFLTDFDRVYPGAKSQATRIGSDGKYLVQRGHWVSQRYSRGSYTAYLPGQFTGIAGLEGQSVGALKFAGEHANSFYEWQGFMEGACLSGIAAADELIRDIQAGRL